MNYERHQLSASWPDMAKEDFMALKDSISHSGLLEPITVFEGQILDGWHRYRACLEVGMKPKFTEFTGDEPAQFVRDKHTRRPLTLTQRLTCIALMSQWRPNGGNQSAVPADCLSSKEIAKAAGGGVRSAEQVKAAITNGAPELVQAMKAGNVGAEKAAVIAQLPKEEQAAAIDKPVSAIKPKKAKQQEPAQEAGGYDPDCKDTQIEEAKETIVALADENEQLRDRLATGVMDGTEEEKQEAAQTIAALREQVRIQAIELDAVKVSRDAFMNENAELKKQIKFYQRKLKEA